MPVIDSNHILDSKVELRGFKENTPPAHLNASNIKDVILGRSNFSNR